MASRDENTALAALLLAQAGTLPSLRHMPPDRRGLRAASTRRNFGSTLSLPEPGTGPGRQVEGRSGCS